MIDYSVATQWNTKKTLDILSIFNENNRVSDIYGAITFNPIGHGRSPYAVPNIGKDEAKEHIKAIQDRGITFNYLLNGNFDSEKLKKQKFVDEVLRYLDEVVCGFKISFVTIAVPELVQIVNDKFPEIKVKLSTINNILSKEDLKRLEGLKFDKVTLGNDAPRNINRLKEMIEYSTTKDYELELMITETCLHKCSTRSIHYRKQTKASSDYSTDWYMNNCTVQRIMYPEEIFKTCWIRPENLDDYIELGITNFKISGRSKTPEWTKQCLEAYIRRKYEGNLLDILGTTPPRYEENSEHLFFIENQALDEFIDNHPMNCYDLDCSVCEYCKKTAINLFEKGQFKINKICGEYEVKNGSLQCKPASYTDELIGLVNAKKGL